MAGEMVVAGHVFDEADELAELREEVQELRAQLRAARAVSAEAKREAAQSVAALRKQLAPLYRALQGVFGEMDAMGVDDAAPAPSSRTSAVWESWKSKMPGRTAQIIDALLLHGPLNSTQIAINIGIHRNNVPPLIHKLNKAGLIDKNGTKYSLKQL